jgi:diguanylate cyclase (GGDEF)-like protein/PAS domain S-box-containing protein
MQGIIIDWNKGSENLYGYSSVEVIGKLVSILHVPEDTEQITLQVLSSVQKMGKWTGDIRMLHKDGSIGWIESMCVPVNDENNQMLGAIGINRDITERKKEAERLESLAYYDYLTKVPNRYLLSDRLEHLIAQSELNKRKFSLLFIDLDNFKLINDKKGHVFGDKVLIEVAERLKQSVHKADTIGRYGGDEFVLLLESISNKDDAARIVEILTKALNAEFEIYNEKLKISCSIGTALYPDDGSTLEALISVADTAMYKAKG